MKINRIFNGFAAGKKYSAVPWCVLLNLLWVYLCYGVCRIAFYFENLELFQDPLTRATAFDWLSGGFIFDTSAIAYTNALYLLLVLFPLHWKETPLFRTIIKGMFVTVNAVCLVSNLMDAVYFPFRQARTTATVFDEFKNETNLLKIFGVEVFRHWYFVLLAALMVFFLVRCYRHARPVTPGHSLGRYYLSRTLWLVVFVLLTVFGMRGCTFTTATRPVSVNDAHQYVRRPIETGIVLNTPFAILRTLTTKPLSTPTYFEDRTQLDLLYSPLHIPSDTLPVRKKNVVILIVESFAREFVGSLNTHLDSGTYAGYTPFTDSLLQRSLTFSGTFSNSDFSIDAMPAVLASIPRMNKPYVVTPFSLNRLNSLATELKNWGYYSGEVDGIFGSQTTAAVKYFQRKNGLTVDGIVGAATLKALGMQSSSSSSGSGASAGRDNDLYLLARMISAEARGEPYTGQVAVGAVILNRVKHPSFPNTISGVIYQPGAFSALNDGQYNQPIADSARRAAQDAMNGWDPSGGAIYYYNPAKTTNKWIWSRPVIATIGNHVFAK